MSNTQTPGTRTARYKDNGNNAPDSKCEQRVHIGQEILPKATVDWRMTTASSQPHRGCHDHLEEGGPERNRTRQCRACHKDHEEAASPHVVPHEAHAAVSARDNRQTPAKLMASMSSTPRPVPTPGCAESSHFFSDGEKC